MTNEIRHMHSGKRVLILDASTASASSRTTAFSSYSREFIMGPIASYFDGIGVEPVFGVASQLDEHEIIELVDSVDAVLIPGGEDVHPVFYGGGESYTGGGFHSVKGDLGQMQAVLRAHDTGKRVFGICRGLQVINIAFGGTLIQHFEGHRNRNRKSYRDRFNTIHIETAAGFFPDVEFVQCSHHQSVENLGEGLEASAFSDDGVVEAVSHESGDIIAVQFHPEAEKTFKEQVPLFANWLLSGTSARIVSQDVSYSDSTYMSDLDLEEAYAADRKHASMTLPMLWA